MIDVTLALGIATFLILLLIYVTQIAGGELGATTHFLFRLFLLIFFLLSLLLLSKSTLDNCEIVNYEKITNYVYTDGNLTQTNTTLLYEENCYTQDKSTAQTFYDLMLALNVFFWTYVIIYLGYWAFKRGFEKFTGEGS